MPTTYVECPDCGKRALSVATRCPHCGFQFPPRPIIRPSPPRSFGASRGLIAVGGAVLALVIVGLLARRSPAGAERVASAPSPPVSPSTEPAAPASAPRAMAVDSTPARADHKIPAAAGAVSAPAPRPAPARSPLSAVRTGFRRYAQTWANVRGDRTLSAPAVAMLNPGDAVTVDSLVRGWYRVVVDGRTLGYVHRSTLDVSRPE